MELSDSESRNSFQSLNSSNKVRQHFKKFSIEINCIKIIADTIAGKQQTNMFRLFSSTSPVHLQQSHLDETNHMTVNQRTLILKWQQCKEKSI